MTPTVDLRRIRLLKDNPSPKGTVVYWVSRDQRIRDNWALLYAQQLAFERREPLEIIFCLAPEFLGATVRHYDFMLRGLKEMEQKAGTLNIGFALLAGKPDQRIPEFVRSSRVSVLVCDFDPLRLKRQWKEKALPRISVPVYEVDAHNIVPCWLASDKQEYAAFTFRPKINPRLDEFLTDFPAVRRHPYGAKSRAADWDKAEKSLTIDRSVRPCSWIEPGEKAAAKHLKSFIARRLSQYAEARNDPSRNGQSGLSPYLHFGQISGQRTAWEASRAQAAVYSTDAFLEELIVRRELSDNFCFYNKRYDTFSCLPVWAQKTLNDHAADRREHVYSPGQLERAQTHDACWNAAQKELVAFGRIHGYMRMYWGKKIIEWSKTPQEAYKTAVYLNDRYELDGRDPNGYAGIAWCFGMHDRPWSRRAVFGTIRYMSADGLKRKFDMQAYIKKTEAFHG